MRLGTLWAEFKAFAFKGNLIDLAVAVVIGTAFAALINSLVQDIIMPAISYAVTAAHETAEATQKAAQRAQQAVAVPVSQPASQPVTGPETQPVTQPATQPAISPENQALISALTVAIQKATPPPAPPAAQPEKAVEFTWMVGRFKIGDFIGAVINFLLIAFAVFIFVVKLLGSVMKRIGSTPSPSEPTTRECPLCLSVIPIRAKRCAYCAADLPNPVVGP